MGTIPAQTRYGRIYIIENGASPFNPSTYVEYGFATGITKPLGAVSPINVYDPDRIGEYVEIGETVDPPDKTTISLTTKLPLSNVSFFNELAEKACRFDVLIIMGKCRSPRNINEYDKVIYIPNARITDYSTDDLGAFDSDASISETIALSTGKHFELIPLSYAARANSLTSVQLVDVVIDDRASCGDCDDVSDGCSKFYSVSLADIAATPEVIYSIDKGVTFFSESVTTIPVATDANAIAVVSEYLTVVSNANSSIEIALKSEFDGGVTVPTFTTVTTGIAVGGEPNDIWSVGNFAYVVGDSGYIYKTSDPTVGLTVVDAGEAVTDVLNAVHAISEDFAVAVGAAGAIVKTDGTTAQVITPPAATEFFAVWVKNEKLWFVAGADGNLYVTSDAGVTWSTRTFSGSGAGIIRDISFSNDNVGYLAHDTIAPAGRVLETIDGGQSWIVAPRGVGTLPANDQITALATCSADKNFVVGVGLADDGTDGFVLLGSD